MQRRNFISSVFKAACATYVSTHINIPYSDSKPISKRHRKTLIAFIDAVIPGCDINNLNHLSGFYDQSLPLAKYVSILIFRINRLTAKLGYKEKFHRLPREARATIIQYGYNHTSLDHDLFHGAIYLSQVTVYGGIFNKNSNADFIGFEGTAASEPALSDWHYTDMRGQESPLTANGNYH